MKNFKHSLKVSGLALLAGLGSFSHAAAPGEIFGGLDLRPELRTNKAADVDATIGSDNAASLGYQFTDSINLRYTQQFMTDFTSNAPDENSRIFAHDGYFQMGLPSLGTIDGIDLSYTPRIYLPTHAGRRNNGMNFIFRNYLTASKQLNSSTTLSLSVIPIFHVYDVSGTGGRTMKNEAGESIMDEATGKEKLTPFRVNPGFENRVYLVGSFKLAQGLTLDVPLMYHAERYRNYDSRALNNNSWNHILYLWPELKYAINEKSTIGVAFYNGNMLHDKDSEGKDSEGGAFINSFKDNVYQVIFSTSL